MTLAKEFYNYEKSKINESGNDERRKLAIMIEIQTMNFLRSGGKIDVVGCERNAGHSHKLTRTQSDREMVKKVI